jgi:hypothetical protein
MVHALIVAWHVAIAHDLGPHCEIVAGQGRKEGFYRRCRKVMHADARRWGLGVSQVVRYAFDHQTRPANQAADKAACRSL